jgi:uncharacterized membrane protein
MTKFVAWVALYPIVTHIGIQTSEIYLPIVYLTTLILFVIYSLKLKSWIVKGFLITAVISAIFLIMFLDKGHVLIQLVPVLILSTLIYIFFKSLLFSNTPIITQFAICVDEKPLNSDKQKYTRGVTVVWLLGFIYMFFQNIIASMWFSIEAWSWISNAGNYIIITLIMFSEFLYRNMRFKNDKISFKTFMIRLSHCRLR